MLSGCGKDSSQQAGGFPPPAVSVAEVLVKPVTPWREFSGRITSTDAVEVRARVGGEIEQVHYREGDLVQAGDLLFTIDQKPYKAELQRASAELKRAEAQSVLSDLELRRAKNLLKRKLLSQDEFDRRKAAVDQANANVQSARASLALARLNLEYTEVRSPINGRTGRALKTPGNLVAAIPGADQLTTVRSLDPMYVEFDSDEATYVAFFDPARQSGESKQARKVFVGLGQTADFPYEGELNFIDNQVLPGSGTVHMRALLNNPKQQLIPGLFARVKLLAAAAEPTVLISDSAILTDQDRKYVYVLGEKNQAVRKDIRPGASYESFRVIKSGLQAGDKVIVYGIQKIFFPNMPVKPQMITMGDPPAALAKPGQGASH